MGFKRIGDTVYVPAADSHLRRSILPGSGIVGTAQDDRQVLIDYEGDRYGQGRTYEERIYHAWDRHTWGENGYPTVARMLVDADELIEVGFLLIPKIEPSEDKLREIMIERYGFYEPAAAHEIRRELARPQLVIDRQDVVDEWQALEHAKAVGA